MTCAGIHWHAGRPYDDSHMPLTRDDLASELTHADHIEAAERYDGYDDGGPPWL